MVPTPTVTGHTTSLESQPNRAHPIFERLNELEEERVRKPLQSPQPAAPAA